MRFKVVWRRMNTTLRYFPASSKIAKHNNPCFPRGFIIYLLYDRFRFSRFCFFHDPYPPTSNISINNFVGTHPSKLRTCERYAWDLEQLWTQADVARNSEFFCYTVECYWSTKKLSQQTNIIVGDPASSTLPRISKLFSPPMVFSRLNLYWARWL